MKIRYVYLEPRSVWTKRGEAHNVWLCVDTENKTVTREVNFFCDTVKRKSDIDEILEFYKNNGYKEV